MEFTEILRGRYGLSERAAGVLMRHASQSVHARKEIIVEEGQRDQEIRFVTEGSARSYVMREDKCVILSFAFEGDPTSSTLGAMARRHFGPHDRDHGADDARCACRARRSTGSSRADAELADWGRRMAEEQLRRHEELFRRLRMARQERAVQARTARISPIIAAHRAERPRGLPLSHAPKPEPHPGRNQMTKLS